MALFDAALIKLVKRELKRSTARRIFYLAVSAKVVNKTEREAERVQKAVLRLRRKGRISYDKIADESRRVVEPLMFDDMDQFCNTVPSFWRSDPWKNAKKQVLVFSEKVGMTPILSDVADRYGVPLFPTIGYTSETFAYEAAQRIVSVGKPAVVLQVGDHDNSGRQMVAAAEQQVRHLVAMLCRQRGIKKVPQIEFKRVAVLPEHIVEYGLPTRPQKEDKRGKEFEVKEAVEIDAMDPDDVQALLAKALRPYLPDDRLAAHEAADDATREKLKRQMRRFRR